MAILIDDLFNEGQGFNSFGTLVLEEIFNSTTIKKVINSHDITFSLFCRVHTYQTHACEKTCITLSEPLNIVNPTSL